MANKKVLFIGATAAAMTAAIAAPVAFADPVQLNDDETAIPFQQIVSAGSSVDMTDITYTMTVAPITYNNDAPTGAYTYAGTISNQPIVVVPAGTSTSGATTATNGNTSTWDYTRTLAQLFGNDAATNFPQAGMYEFSITEAVTGGTSADTTKWTYDNPTYKLQVLIENTTENGEITGREYAGWTLLEWDDSSNQYVKVNSGATGSEGKAVFEADYSGTAQLNVSKVVSGDYASTTYAFPIQVTLYLPSYAADASITAVDPDNQAITATSGANTTTRVYDVSLKHGETATFTVPVGTTYQIVEDPSNADILDAGGISYDPEIEWTVDDGVPPIPSSLSTATLSELTALSADLRSGTVRPANVASLIGETVTVTLADETTATARLVDASSARGLVFQFDYATPIATAAMNNASPPTNAGGWMSSALRTNLNSGEIYTNKLSGMTIAGSAVDPVAIPTTAPLSSLDANGGTNNGGTPQVITTSGDKFWLPSVDEVYGPSAWATLDSANANSWGYSGTENGTQFAYYASLNPNPLGGTNNPLASSSRWWLRSAYPGDANNVMEVAADGHAGRAAAGGPVTGGVVPCFCL